MLEVDLPPEGLPPEGLAAAVTAHLRAEIDRHLRADGLDPVDLGVGGIQSEIAPPCESAKRELLARAPRVTVVICTRDRPDQVRTTLSSLLKCSYPAARYEVVVVDNAAAGEALTGLIDTDFAGEVRVRVVREPKPGLSRARNCGLAAAEGEIVLFADDDVQVDLDWIATLVAPFDDERVGATSGLTLPDVLETPTQRWVEGFGGRNRGFDRRVYDVGAPPPDEPLFPFTVGSLGAGRNMAFRRDLLLRLGGFDTALGPGTVAHDGDDIEALLRVLLAGYRVVHDPGAIVWHAHPRAYRELEDRVWGYGIALTACLTRAIIDRPGLLGTLFRKLPRGIAFALSGDSAKNVGRQEDYPRRLIWLELGGVAYGPIAYARSRADQRRRERAWQTRTAS
jgi:GT2 family glycosyltransferase